MVPCKVAIRTLRTSLGANRPISGVTLTNRQNDFNTCSEVPGC